jgi:hypothetical protein
LRKEILSKTLGGKGEGERGVKKVKKRRRRRVEAKGEKKIGVKRVRLLY